MEKTSLFKKGNTIGKQFEVGNKGNPWGRAGKNGKLQNYIEDALSVSGKPFKKEDVKQECNKIKNTLKDLPSMEEVRVYNEFLLAGECAKLKKEFLAEIADRLDKSRTQEQPMSNRDLSSLVSSLNAVSVSSQKVMSEYIFKHSKNPNGSESPDSNDTMQIINLESTK